MGNRSRNTAILLIAAGLFILLENYINFFTVAALLFIALGINRVRSAPDKTGYVLLAVGGIMLVSGHFTILLSAALLVLGLYYIQSKRENLDETFMQKHTVLESYKRDKEPWELKNISMRNVAGEISLDLSLALIDQPETTVMMSGVFGDVDVIVPEFIGISVHASALVGQITAGGEKETGLVNKMIWQSPNYETSDQKVKLVVSYVVGDIDIKFV